MPDLTLSFLPWRAGTFSLDSPVITLTFLCCGTSGDSLKVKVVTPLPVRDRGVGSQGSSGTWECLHPAVTLPLCQSQLCLAWGRRFLSTFFTNQYSWDSLGSVSGQNLKMFHGQKLLGTVLLSSCLLFLNVIIRQRKETSSPQKTGKAKACV